MISGGTEMSCFGADAIDWIVTIKPAGLTGL